MRCYCCGAELPEDASFCHHCGERHSPSRKPIFSEGEIAEIQKEAQPAEYAQRLASVVEDGFQIEHRDVAVMFVDLSGFSDLVSELPPDQLRNVVREVYSLMSEAIAKSGGYVDKFIGDEVMAIFGAPIALERPCDRAIVSADEITIGLAGVNQRFKSILPRPLSVHAGVAFGRVQAGRLGDSSKLEYTFLGETVNIAKRLTEAASSGAVLVESMVKACAKEAFEFEGLGKLMLSGIKHAVEVFRLTGPRVIGRGRPGFSKLGAPMLGRDAEFDKLREALQKLVSCYPDPEPSEPGEREYGDISHVFGIVGEAGVGKSRLRRELRTHLKNILGDADFHWVAGGAWSIGQTPLYWPVKLQIAEAMGFGMSASRDRITATMAGLSEDAGDDVQLTPYLCHLFAPRYPDGPLSGLDPKAIKDNLWLAIRQLYARWAQQKPLVLVFEDMQWADGGTRDFVDYLANFVADFPVVVLLLYRPNFRPKFAARENVPFTEIELKRLSGDAERRLLDFYVQSGDMERRFVRRLRRYSEGNPLFVEEFLLMLLEQGKLVADGSKMRLVEDIREIPPPAGLADVLTERFDRLPLREKRVAYYAAVIGRSFPYSLLSYLHGSLHGTADVLGEISSLLEREIIFPKSLEPEPVYFFKHAVTREILVSRLVIGLRRELSELIASKVEELYEGQIDQFHGMLSEHWEMAGETGEAARHAALWGVCNTKQQLNFEAQSAFERYDRLCDRLPKSPLAVQELSGLLTSRIDVLQVLGDWERAIHFCKELARLSEGRWRLPALCKEARLRQMMGDWEKSLSLAEEALDLATQVGDREAVATSMRTIGIVHSSLGNVDEALRRFEASLAIRRELGDPCRIAHALVDVGIVKSASGKDQEALSLFNDALSIYRELGNRDGIGTSLHEIAVVYSLRCDYVRALGYYEEALCISRELGDRGSIAFSLGSMGEVHSHRGDHDQALECYDQAHSIFRELGDRRSIALSMINIGAVHGQCGHIERALQHYEGALSFFQDLSDKWGIGVASARIASARADKGDWAGAENEAVRAVEINRSSGNRESLSNSLSVLCRALSRQACWANSLSCGNEAQSIADERENHEQMIITRLALSEAHLEMLRWHLRGEGGSRPPLSRHEAASKATEHARSAMELAQSKGFKGHALKARELLEQVERI